MLNDSDKNLVPGKQKYAALFVGAAGLSLAAAFFLAHNPPGPDIALDKLPDAVLKAQPAPAPVAPVASTSSQPAPAPSPHNQAAERLLSLAQKQTPSRNDVRNMQKTLNALGYNAGKADGIFYRKTAKSFAAFLKDNPEKTNLLSGWVFERLIFQRQRTAITKIAEANPAVKTEIENRIATAKTATAPDARRMKDVYALALPVIKQAPPVNAEKPAPVPKKTDESPSSRIEPKIPPAEKSSAAPQPDTGLIARAKELARNSEFRQALRNNDLDSAIRIMKRQPPDPLQITHPVSRTAISSPFMATRQRKSPHQGIDYPVPSNTSVMAAAAGVVASSSTHKGYGPSVLIDHGNGFYTRYAHLSRQFTKPGMIVAAGQVIAKSGNRGRTTGPHLHFETLLRDGEGRLVAVDPLKIMDRNVRMPTVRAAAIDEAHAEARALSRKFRHASAYARLDYPEGPAKKTELTPDTARLLIATLKENPALMGSVPKSMYRRMIDLGCRDELISLSSHAGACLRRNATIPGLASFR